MNKIGIFYHPLVEAAFTKAKQVQDFLVANGVSVWLCSAWEGEKARAQLSDTDLILSVGGDGTILRSAQAVVPGTTPITGINLGTLGFMTEFSADEALERLPALLAGEGWLDERAMIEAEVSAAAREPPRTFHALNDVVVARGEVVRLVRIEASLDGQHLATYKADGVIVATATGSTGYALAAGGPILYPQSRDFLLVPITPHLSSAYALVLPSKTVVQLHLSAVHQATLSIDGHVNLPLANGATITIKLSRHTIRFLRIHPRNSFYRSLEQKLKGK